MNRIEPVIDDLKSEKDIGERMELIMYALNDTVTPIPEEGNICTFKYYAKTPNIEYDQHPLVAVSDVFLLGVSWYQLSLERLQAIYLGRIRNSGLYCSKRRTR